MDGNYYLDEKNFKNEMSPLDGNCYFDEKMFDGWKLSIMCVDEKLSGSLYCKCLLFKI